MRPTHFPGLVPSLGALALLTVALASSSIASGQRAGIEPGSTEGSGAALAPQPRPLLEGITTSSLGPGGACDAEGRYTEAWQVELDPATWARVFVSSPGLDTVLRIDGPDGFRLESDDFLAGTLYPAFELAPPRAGTYTIHVTGYAEGLSGGYQLGFERVAPGSDGTSLLLGGPPVAAMLESSGLSPLVTSWGSHWIDGLAGQRVTLRVTSPDFDTFAVLSAPTGLTWTNDDANDLGEDGTESELDSTITAILPESGPYHLMVFAYGGTGAGAYRVRSTVRPPVLLDPEGNGPGEGFAGTQTRGRILGVFAGISDYADQSDLYGCADDARLLARALSLRGVLAEADALVLTDAQVTRAELTRALQTVAARATSDDVVVVFFSGHGDQTAAVGPDPAELDGLDETLELNDGPLRDNELVELIDPIRADTVILALDACHSGGFERDFMTRPGRIGLFSSSEDVLSDTAEPVRAGGYLAYFLRQALLGRADARPTDGALTAGELVDYVYAGFVAHHDEFNDGDGQAPFQMLEADRGSLGYNDTLWLYPRRPDGSLAPIPADPLESPLPGPGSSSAGGRCFGGSSP